MNQVVKLIGLSIAGVAALFLFVPVSAAQQPQSGVAARAVPRTADGKPDLSGIWQTLTTANWDIEPRKATWGVPASVGIVEGGEIPYQPGGREKKAENLRNRLTADTEARCYLPGVPRIMYMPYPFQIVQTPKMVVMLFEVPACYEERLHGHAPSHGPLEWWMGESRGRWEGDTLVVERAGNHNARRGSTCRAISTARRCAVIERYTVSIPITCATREHRGSEGLHAAVEDEHAPLPASRAAFSTPRLRVLRLFPR